MDKKKRLTIRFKNSNWYGVSLPLDLYEKLKSNQGQDTLNAFIKRIIADSLYGKKAKDKFRGYIEFDMLKKTKEKKLYPAIPGNGDKAVF